MKNGWKVRSSFSAMPTLPVRVDATIDIFQAVILSAMGKLKLALPFSSVKISGRQSSVSGKYWRKRGVKNGLLAGAPSAPICRSDFGLNWARVVSIIGATDETSTVSADPPTARVASAFVVPAFSTGTCMTIAVLKPRAENSSR